MTVSNDGGLTGTSPAVTDMPDVPSGMTITKVTVDGAQTALENGTFKVTNGVEIMGGESKSFKVSVVYGVKVADISADDWKRLSSCPTDPTAEGGLNNSVSSDEDSDGVTNNKVCSTITGDPAIKIVKKVNGDDANTAPGVVVDPGSDLSFTFEVTNTGATPLSGVNVTDNIIDAKSIKCTKTDLASGESMTCTASMKAPAKSATAHANTATTTGTDPNGKTVTDDDDANAITPAFSVSKTALTRKIAIASQGQQSVTAKYLVRLVNSGTVTATSKSVIDTPAVPGGTSLAGVKVNGAPAKVGANGDVEVISPASMAPGDERTATVEVTYTIDPAKVTKDQWVSLSTCDTAASGVATKGLFNSVKMPFDGDGKENNDACVPLTGTPHISIIKQINGDDADSAPGVTVDEGSDMQVTFKVTNDGNVPLESVKVSDDTIAAEDITCPKDTLAVGEVMECSATIPAPESGDAQHTNTATAEGVPPVGTKVTASNAANAHTPSFAVGKTAAVPEVALTSSEKQEVAAEYLVTLRNIGSIDAASKDVIDTPADIENMTIARVLVNGEETEVGEDGTFTAITSQTIKAGDMVTVPVTVVYDLDPKELSADQWSALATCDTEGDGDPAKGILNRVAMPHDNDGSENNDACVSITGTPHISIVKSINGDDANAAPGVEVAPGEVVKVEFKVTNDGLLPLSGVEVTDNVISSDDIKCPESTDLGIGESMTCTAEYKMPTTNSTQHTNVAKAVGTSPLDEKVEASDLANAKTFPPDPTPEQVVASLARTGVGVDGALASIGALFSVALLAAAMRAGALAARRRR